MITKEERHAAILERLMQFESVQVTDLATLLNVSLVTIRKDLTELEKANKLYRSHGKAILINPYATNRNVNDKEKLFTAEKRNIGREAAQLIERDYDHNAVPTTFIATPSLRHIFSLDFNIAKTTLRLGYMGDYRQAKVNNLKYHSYSHLFVIGITRTFRLTRLQP